MRVFSRLCIFVSFYFIFNVLCSFEGSRVCFRYLLLCVISCSHPLRVSSTIWKFKSFFHLFFSSFYAFRAISTYYSICSFSRSVPIVPRNPTRFPLFHSGISLVPASFPAFSSSHRAKNDGVTVPNASKLHRSNYTRGNNQVSGATGRAGPMGRGQGE